MIKEFNVKCYFSVLDPNTLPDDSAESIGIKYFVDKKIKAGKAPLQAPYYLPCGRNEVYVLKEDGFYEIYVLDEGKEAQKPIRDISPENLALKLKKVLNKTNIVVNGVLTIGKGTYYIDDCEYLCNKGITKVEIPSTCHVKNGAFMGCPNLEEVVFYDVEHGEKKETSIFPYAFFDCKKLKKIVLPETLKSIGKNAFGHCLGIKDVTSKSDYPITFSSKKDIPDDECAFGGLDVSQCSLHVPASSIIIYKDKNFWKEFGNITAIK
jgi:hypothetical protein